MRLLWFVAGLVVALVLGGVAYASIPASDGTINGCYKTSNPNQGQLIVVDSTASCPNGYTALNWSQSGVPGYTVVEQRISVTSGDGADSVTALVQCPTGKKPLGGGARLEPPVTPEWFVTVSQPWGETSHLSPTGWFAEAYSSDPAVVTNGNMALVAYAVCASI